jgi:hypothetical protein
MIKYYRGQIKRHAVFWSKFRELPNGGRFDAFVAFLKEVNREVKAGTCTLRDAGFALQPAFYDDDIYKPRESELTFAQDAVEDLIVVADSNPKEAAQIWSHILNVMEPYL